MSRSVVRARRAGSLAAAALGRGASGRVLSVHRRAVNVALGGGAIVAVVPEETPLHPWAIGARLDPAAVVAGDRASASPGLLEVGRIRISLAGAEIAELRLRSRPQRRSGALLQAALRVSERSLRTRTLAISAADPFGPALLDAPAAFAAGGPPGALTALVGVGEGLTPSGDDVLVGVLAGLDLAGDCEPGAGSARSELVVALTPEVLGGTARLSAQMLAAAAVGRYPEPVVALLATVAAGAVGAPLERAVADVLALGHRSGPDLLAGVVAGLERALGPAAGVAPAPRRAAGGYASSFP